MKTSLGIRFWRSLCLGWFWLWWAIGSASADVNIWTNYGSGKWESENWSLGIPPAVDQSVMIFNDSWKAVCIDRATILNSPDSVTINDLLVRSYSSTVNTLLLNYAGTDIPLRIKNGLTIGANGIVMNLESGLIVDNAGINLMDGILIQDGGFVIATNTTALITGVYALTNGLLQVSNISIGGIFTGVMNQYGGDTKANAIQVGDTGSYTATGSGTYKLYGGSLTANQIRVGGQNTYSPFIQNGGTNSVRGLLVAGWYGSSGFGPAHYFLNGGELVVENTTIASTLSATGKFEQTGGRHLVLQRLYLEGETAHAISFYPARYVMLGGELYAETFRMGHISSMALTNGTISVRGALEFDGMSHHRETSYLAGGTLACSNVMWFEAGAHLIQSGGALIVTNLFSFGGFPMIEPGYAVYSLLGGTLVASNMEICAEMIVAGNGQNSHISNPGFFRLERSLTASNAIEHLGRFILASNATINLPGVSRLSFNDSSAEMWQLGARLSVLNWNGSTNGGAPEQLIFGVSSKSLTPVQLEQIRFVNPAGLPPGTNYVARILETGEVVPAIIPPCLDAKCEGKILTLTWPENCYLQAATNVEGPYVEYPELHCPVTVDTSVGAQWFFRVRQAY